MIRRRPHVRTVLALALGLTLVAASVAAQGKSGPSPGSRRHQPRPGGGPQVTTPGNPSPAVASLTSWLDDATVPEPGEWWLGVSIARWSTDQSRVLFAPIGYVTAGLAPRVSAGVSVPVYHLRDSTGATTSGVGDVSIFGKIGLVNPAAHGVGVALTPIVVEYTTVTSTGSQRQAAWAVPVGLEARGTHGRVYGSIGYFSSGALFANGAGEWSLTSKFGLSGTLGVTRATGSAVQTASSLHRVDTSASAFVLPSPAVSLFVAVGRSFSGDPLLDGGPWVAAGIAIHHPKR